MNELKHEPTSESKKATCKTCGKEFLMIVPELKFYEKKEMPEPENCPECRQKRRLSLRNERKFFKRNCDKCGKSMISTYRTDSEFIVYCQDCFWKYLG